jgi:ribose-phosphate pyrophosphokinase
MPKTEIRIFALDNGRELGEKIADRLGFALSQHEARDFEDGEHKLRPLVNVRGRDVYVLQPLSSDARFSVNDRLCRLLFFIGALKDAAAARITVLAPCLCYARKDRKTKSRDPVTTRYVAQLFEAVGTNRLITLDVHNLAAFQNAFRCGTDHLEANPLFVDYFAPKVRGQEVVVLSPDAGGVKRADRFRKSLHRVLQYPVSMAFMEKYRSRGKVRGNALVGDVAKKTVIIMDDLISSGTTMVRAAEACREQGAKTVFAAATHGIFVGDAEKKLSNPALHQLVITSSLPPFRLSPAFVQSKLVILDISGLFADAIRAVHSSGSIVELLKS